MKRSPLFFVRPQLPRTIHSQAWKFRLKATVKVVDRSNYTPTLVVYQLALNLIWEYLFDSKHERSSIAIIDIALVAFRNDPSTYDRDRRCSDWPRTLSEDYACMNAIWLATKTIRRIWLHGWVSIRDTDGLTYKGDNISSYASSRTVEALNLKLSKTVPNWRLEPKNHTLFMTKMAKIDTLFITKTAKHHTLWGRTYLYSAYNRVPPSPLRVYLSVMPA